MQQSLFGSLIAQATPAVEAPVVAEDLFLDSAVFTVIDLETTGLTPKKNAITEVTAIQYRDGQEIGKYSTLVRPTEAISEEVVAITGITDDMVKDAPPLVSVLSELCAFVGAQPIIVGHNVGFDLRFIQEKLQQVGLETYIDRFAFNRALCTKVLAQKALPGLPNYDGMMVATHCGVYNPNPHRAENDVRMSAGILFHIIARLRVTPGMSNVGELLTYQGLIS